MTVNIRDYDKQSEIKHLHSNVYELEVPGLAEARPSLVRRDSVYIKESTENRIKYEGKVHETKESSVVLGFNRKFSEIFIENFKYHIEFGYNRRTMKVEHQALQLIEQHDAVSYFFPKKQDIDDQPLQIDKFFDSKLNVEQKSAIINAIHIKPVPYLIFGPPGTGKTRTVAETILQIWKINPDVKILACAPSNAAVNEIAIRLFGKIPRTDILRLLGYTYAHDVRVKEISSICNLRQDGTYYMPSISDLLKFRVVLTSLVTAARLINGGIPEDHYSYVIVDEAGYATETETLVAVAGILTKRQGKFNGQLVLAGDPRQLGPIIHSDFVKSFGFEKSMLERLIDTCEPYQRDENGAVPYNPLYITKLVKNYRSHPSILHVSNVRFYNNELVAQKGGETELFINWEHIKKKDFPVIFHNVTGDDRREEDSPSFFNIQEVEEVLSYLSKIVDFRVSGRKISGKDIGIITPYRKQAQKIREACVAKKWNDILIGSVEQFQGREKLVIIVSTVRSQNRVKYEGIDNKFKLGFVRNPKRFNVALTRAKALLIVIGNADVLKTNEDWHSFIKYCKDNNSVDGKPFDISSCDIIQNNLQEDEGNEAVNFSRGNH